MLKNHIRIGYECLDCNSSSLNLKTSLGKVGEVLRFRKDVYVRVLLLFDYEPLFHQYSFTILA